MRGRARACAHGDTTPMPNAPRGLPTQDTCRLSPSFRTQHPDLRRRRIDFCCYSSYARMLPEISAKNFPRNSWWAYFHSDGKKKGFQSHCRHCSYRTWKALYTLDLLYNHPISNLVFIMRTYSNLMVRLPCLENSYTVRVARQTMVHPPVHVGCVKAIMALVLEQIVRTFILQSDRIRRSKMALFG